MKVKKHTHAPQAVPAVETRESVVVPFGQLRQCARFTLAKDDQGLCLGVLTKQTAVGLHEFVGNAVTSRGGVLRIGHAVKVELLQ